MESVPAEFGSSPVTTPVDNDRVVGSTNLDIADDIQAWFGSPLPGEILRTRIELTAGCCRLGLQLSGQIGKEPTDNFTRGVFVAGILPDGAAANNGVIRVGDQILQVNDEKLLGCSHLNASAIIKSMTASQYDVVLFRRFASDSQIECQLQDNDCVTNNLSSKSLCLTDITNVSFVKSAETDSAVLGLQRKPKPSNSIRSEDNSDVLSSNTSQHTSFAGLPSVTDSILNNESFRTTDFVTNEQRSLANNASVYANVNNYNAQNCSQSDGGVDLSALNNNTCDVDTSINRKSSAESNLGDVLANHVDVDGKMARSSEGSQQQQPQQRECIQSSVDSSNQQTTVFYIDETVAHNRQPSVACSDDALPFIDDAAPESVSDVQKQVNSTRSEHVATEKDHKATGKRKAGRTGHRSQHAVSHGMQTANDDPTKCVPVPGQETVIEIDKGWQPLGISVIGGCNTLLGAIVVSEIFAGGVAARDGRLRVGDQILEVNGEDFRCDVTDEWATEVLHQTPGKVRLTIYRDVTPFNLHEDNDVYEVFTIDLLKKPGKGLGFSITGRQHDNGIFISDVIKGGVADLDGQLVPGDQILVINGNSVQNASQPEIAALLKTLMGRVSLTVGRVRCLSRSSSSSTLSVDSDDVEAGDQSHKTSAPHEIDTIKHKGIKAH